MTIRQYLSSMLIGTALCWSAVALIVTMIDPTISQSPVFAMFYVSIFFACAGTFSVIGFFSRVFVLNKRYQISRQVAVSVRQSVMLSLIIVIGLFLQSKEILTWWNASLIVIALTLLESFFISASNRGNETSQ
ncbi:MAG: hypothetical protein V1738_05410 [Patescibacteria group bacterium]